MPIYKAFIPKYVKDKITIRVPMYFDLPARSLSIISTG